MARYFTPPREQAVDANGAPLVGAKLYFYETGTSTPLAVYKDEALTTPHSVSSLTSDENGRWAAIYTQASDYKVVLQNASGSEIWSVDPVSPEPVTVSNSGFTATHGTEVVLVKNRFSQEMWLDDFESVATDGSTDTSTAFSEAITASLDNNLKPIRLPAGIIRLDSTLTKTDGFPCTPIIGSGIRSTTLDLSNNSGNGLRFKGGSGVIARTQISDFSIKGDNSATTLISIEGQGGLVFERIRFDRAATGVALKNLDGSEFTEFITFRDCLVDSLCKNFISCTVGSGTNSFRALHIDNTHVQTDGSQPIILLNSGCLLYNAYLGLRVTTEASSTAIIVTNNSSYRAIFAGDIFLESGSASTITLGSGSDNCFYTGSISSINQQWSKGSFYFVEGAQLNTDGSVTLVGAKVDGTTTLNASSTTIATIGDIDQVQGAAEWSIHITGTNHDMRFTLHTSHDGSGGAGYVVTTATLRTLDTASLGTPTFSVNSSGQLVITNSNYASTAVTCYWSKRMIGQRTSSTFRLQ